MIELMLVIFAILVLIIILVPSLAAARRHAKEVHRQAQLRHEQAEEAARQAKQDQEAAAPGLPSTTQPTTPQQPPPSPEPRPTTAQPSTPPPSPDDYPTYSTEVLLLFIGAVLATIAWAYKRVMAQLLLRLELSIIEILSYGIPLKRRGLKKKAQQYNVVVRCVPGSLDDALASLMSKGLIVVKEGWYSLSISSDLDSSTPQTQDKAD